MKEKQCKICGSIKGLRILKRYNNNIVCGKHRRQLTKYNKIMLYTCKDMNEIIIDGDVARIMLYEKQKSGLEQKIIGEALIDKKNISLINYYKWCLSNNYVIAKSTTLKKMVKLHSIILPKKEGFIIDHINREPLDNRECNLRYLTTAENNINKKRVRGYYICNNKFCSKIGKNYKQILLGRFNTKEEAISAYEKALEVCYPGVKNIKCNGDPIEL